MVDRSPRVAWLAIYPIKSLDPVVQEGVNVLPSGALENDRRWALVDDQRRFINSKRTPRLHTIRADYDLPALRVRLRDASTSRGPSTDWLEMETNHSAIASFFSGILGMSAHVIENREQGFPDDLESPGPTMVSTASLREVGRWLQIDDLDEIRRRFRSNIEFGDLPAFGEDALFAPAGQGRRLQVGSARFLGVNPCQRCVVPTRHPLTGQGTPHFQRIFADQRKRGVNPGVAMERFDHFYRLAVNTRSAGEGTGATVALGDPLTILETAPLP